MSSLATTLVSLSLCLGLTSLPGLVSGAWAEESKASFPALITATARNVSSGRGTLPFIVSLARQPELLQPPYLRLVLGSPDGTRGYAFPSTTYHWTPADGSFTHFVLTRSTEGRPPTGGEMRQLVVTFKHSAMQLKDVRSELGKPIRRYFDNGTSLVELYQLAPGSTVAVSEPANTFDVSQITVHYSGPYLPPVSAQDQVQAKLFRLKQIDHHLTRGNTERGFALLQDQVTDYPQDITAHLSLADALRRKCSVNASFAEYRRVLSMAQAAGDVDAQKQAIKALSPYGLVPANLAIVRPVSLDSTLVKVSPTGAAPTLTAAKAGSNLQ